MFLATLKEKLKGKKKTMKYHQAISFNGFKLQAMNKNNHKQSKVHGLVVWLPKLDGCKTQPFNIDSGLCRRQHK